MDNLKFYTKQDLDETTYYKDLINQPGWKRCYYKPNPANPHRSKSKHRKTDKETGTTHYLYISLFDNIPVKHSFYLSSFGIFFGRGNIFSPDHKNISYLENKIIKSMLNVGIKYPGEIELTGFDFDINVKFKNSKDMEIVKESLINNLNWNKIRPTNIYDTANGFGVYNRSSLNRIGLLVYDKQMQLKSKDIHSDTSVAENCLRWSYRINGPSAMQSVFRCKTLPFDALLVELFNYNIIRVFEKRLNELGIFKGAKIVTKDTLKKVIKENSNMKNGKYPALEDLRKIMINRRNLSPTKRKRLKDKCKNNGICFTWVEDVCDREIYLHDMVMEELKLVLEGRSECSYKDTSKPDNAT